MVVYYLVYFVFVNWVMVLVSRTSKGGVVFLTHHHHHRRRDALRLRLYVRRRLLMMMGAILFSGKLFRSARI